MGICSAKSQNKQELKEQHEILPQQSPQLDPTSDAQRNQKSETNIPINKLGAQTSKQNLKGKMAPSPSTKPVKRMVWADQIIENSGQRGTLKTWISIKNAHFSKYYSVLNKEQSKCQIKLKEQLALVQHNLSGKIRVAEFIQKTLEGDQLVESIFKTQLNHPNLIKLDEIFQDASNYQIIHDFCNGGSLQQYLSNTVYTQQQAALILKQIIEIISYIHKLELNHNGLSLTSFQKYNQSNSNYIKLVDYKPIYVKKMISAKDNLMYLAPEAIMQPDIYTQERDIWSIGIMLYRMLSGQFPFKGSNKDELLQSIQKYQTFDEFDTESIPRTSVDFIKKLLRFDPKKRIKLNLALNDQWVKHNIEKSQVEQDQIVKQLDQNHPLSFLQCCFLQFMITTFQSDQEQSLYQIFGQFDINHDGKINRQELTQAYLKHCSNLQEVKEHVDSVFKGVDINRNGEIDFQEFLIGVIDRNILITIDNLKEAFRILSDVEGHISLAKMCQLYHNKKQQLKQQFSVYENNQINFKQFQELMFDAL
ncbi:unnamed protein product [Paramecium pentaurelia]|uniref:Calcium-dependent protein kinase n=1 Tax=Paramecium pentaurelia TaxID=43138 RepID=A0A8S1XXY9_9CILI|nr:unnamed protein product [Paramecium pentaurelia]